MPNQPPPKNKPPAKIDFEPTVVQIELFDVPDQYYQNFKQEWGLVASFLKKQSGITELRLHKQISPSRKKWIYYAEWKDTNAYHNALKNQLFYDFIRHWIGEDISVPEYKIVRLTSRRRSSLKRERLLNNLPPELIPQFLSVMACLLGIILALVLIWLRFQ